MKINHLVVTFFITSLILAGCGGGGGPDPSGKLVVGDIEGPSTVNEGGTAVQFHVPASGDTGITYMWAVDPAGAGTFKTNGEATTAFHATPRASDLAAIIRCVVTSDNGGPIIQTKNITIKDSDQLTVSEIMGPSSVGENSSTQYAIEAAGDTGINFQWELIQSALGDITTPKSSECLLNTGPVTQDTDVTLRCRINSDNYPELIKQKTVTIMDVNQLIVSSIDGVTLVPELAFVDYSVEAMGDPGITYLWEVAPLSAGVMANETLATATLGTALVHEDTPAQVKVTVNSEHYGPVVRTLDIIVQDANALVVGQIFGPEILDERTIIDYSVLAGGDTGITYQWSVVPDDVLIISGETTDTLNVEAPDVEDDIPLTLSVMVDSDNYAPVERTLDISVKNVVLIVGAIEGPDPVNENSATNYHVDAEGDSGIYYFWEVSPVTAGYFDFMYQPTATLNTGWAGPGETLDITCTVSSDYYGPEIRNRTISINDTQQLWVGVIEGPPTVDEDLAVEFTVDAINDEGITYLWTLDPPTAGILWNETTETVTVRPYEVDEDTPASLTVEVNSENYPGETREKDFDIINLILEVGSINGDTELDELDVENYSINASGDTGITYLWEVDPADAGSWANEDMDVANFNAGPVWDFTPATIWCTVDSDHNDPIQMSVAIEITDTIVLTVDEIEGPIKIDENEQAQYEINTTGDSGIAYLWEVSPTGAGNFDNPGIYNPNFSPAVTGADVDATITCTVTSDHYPFQLRTLDIKIWPFVNHGWVNPIGGTGSEVGYSVDTDSMGNIYTVGAFSDAVDFEPGLGNTTLFSNGVTDCYLAKYNSAGDLSWAVSWGGTDYDNAISLITDGGGNCYVTGHYRNSCDFDPGPATYQFDSMGDSDVYLVKFDPNGIFEWVSVWGGSSFETGWDVVLDPTGNVFVTGCFSGTVDFDPTPQVDELSSNGQQDSYLSKYNSSGVYQWAASWGGTNNDYGYSVALDSSQNIFVAGKFNGAVDFDPGPGTYQRIAVNSDDDAYVTKFSPAGIHEWAVNWDANVAWQVITDNTGSIYTTGSFDGTVDFDPSPAVADFASFGGTDCYLSKLNAAGDYVWARTWGGSSNDDGRNLDMDSVGNILVTGYFQNTVDFDTGAGAEEHTADGATDGFVTKFDQAGTHHWAATWGSVEDDYGYGVAAYSNQFVCTTGYFESFCDFAPGTDVEEYQSVGGDDTYILKHLSDGTW